MLYVPTKIACFIIRIDVQSCFNAAFEQTYFSGVKSYISLILTLATSLVEVQQYSTEKKQREKIVVLRLIIF